MREPLIYLDHNATAPMLPEVADAVREASLQYPGNPASQHEAGRLARRAIEAARTRIGELLGARTTGMNADQVIFTSGGTESNNLALRGLLSQPRPRLVGANATLFVSSIEHPSIARCAEHLAASGAQFELVPVDCNGLVRLDQLSDLVSQASSRKPHPSSLASIMLANNETGVIQPIAEAAATCQAHGVLLHTDATQAVGKIPVDFTALGVDALTATAHKFHGPQGVGVLIVRRGAALDPSLHGGFQQGEARPGTESVALAIGMQRALELWHAAAEQRRERMTSLRDAFERAILDGDASAIVIGAAAPRLPHTSNIAFVGLNRQALAMALDLAGVACSTGSACASGSSEPSPTLLAMGLPEGQISSSLRFSIGASTTAADTTEAARRILAVCNRLRAGK